MTTATFELDVTLLESGYIDLRNEGEQHKDYKVVAVELISPDDHDDLYSAVIKNPEGKFIKIFFIYAKAYNDVRIHDYESLAPKEVFPKEVTVTIYE